MMRIVKLISTAVFIMPLEDEILKFCLDGVRIRS